MAVHFKFRSAVEYDSISIEGHFISIANLKEKIVEQKNLGKGTDFDLVVTNAQTGEEYTDEGFLVPKNTSVIIKRVPATRAKATLLVHDQSRADASEQTSSTDSKDGDGAFQSSATPNAGLDSMDDFGVDLYAVAEPAPTRIDADENSKIVAMVTKTASDWQRQTQETFTGSRGYGRGVYGRGFARGRGYGRAIPPSGYVCHRCGQPGHFIQHCPTNGDPAYDMKRVKLPVGIPKTRLKADQEGSYILPDGSVAVMQPDETVFAKEADALLSARPAQMELPSELGCPLCQGIFKEAVMIPCCHYSFCDKCIRHALIEKGKCPQCGSTKFKNDDLLPNIALRQAIDRFLDAQLHTTSADEGAPKQQQVPDVGSCTKAKVSSPALSGLKIELRKPPAANVAPLNAVVAEKEPSPPFATESVCESAVGPKQRNVVDASSAFAEAGNASAPINSVHKSDESEAVEGRASKVNDDLADHPVMKDVSGFVKEGKQHVNDVGESAMVSKISEPPSHKEAEGVALESEVSKGKKKKKRARQMPADGVVEHMVTGKPRKGDRFCYLCGSPEHLARDCMENAVENSGPYPPQRGMFRPGGPVPHGGMPPYGQEMYWHGPPIPHVRPFPMGYGEGMYGPGPVAMPFEAPMMPIGPYGVPPYMPPMYPNPPMHGGFMGGIGPGMMVPMERPLSREEFMELQERERRRRLMHERQERERSQDRSYSRDGVGQSHSPDLEQKLYDRRVSVDEHQSLSRKRELDQHSVRNYSDETVHHKSKSKQNRKLLSERLAENAVHRQLESASDDDMTFDDSKSRRSHSERRQRNMKAISSETRKESRHHRHGSVERCSSELEDGEQSYSARIREKTSREGEHVRSSKQSSSKRNDGVSFKKYNYSNSKKHDDSRILHSELVSGEDSHLSHHRSKMTVSEDSKYVSHSERRNPGQIRQYYEGAGLKDKNHSHEVVDHDDASPKDDEKHMRRKHQSHAKSKSDTDVMDYASEDESRKKKSRKHREDSSERLKGITYDYLEDDVVHEAYNPRKHKLNYLEHLSGPFTEKHKCKSPHLAVSPVEDHIEESRWQMDSGLDGKDEDTCHQSHRFRYKHQRSYSVKSK